MYQIISDKSAEKLAEKVNAMKNHPDRWIETGGVAVQATGKDALFFQAIVRSSTTPLMEDLQSELCADHAKILIELGADVNAKDKQGITPLMFAGAFSTEELVQLLISKKADVNATDEEGDTPLTWTVMHSKRVENVQALIEAGANVNAVSASGHTILMSALINNDSVGIIKYLIDKGADVNAKYDSYKLKGKSVLMIALEHHHPYVTIKRLLDAGVDVNAEDSHGRTPWNYAKNADTRGAVLELLKEYGVVVKED